MAAYINDVDMAILLIEKGGANIHVADYVRYFLLPLVRSIRTSVVMSLRFTIL